MVLRNAFRRGNHKTSYNQNEYKHTGVFYTHMYGKFDQKTVLGIYQRNTNNVFVYFFRRDAPTHEKYTALCVRTLRLWVSYIFVRINKTRVTRIIFVEQKNGFRPKRINIKKKRKKKQLKHCFANRQIYYQMKISWMESTNDT